MSLLRGILPCGYTTCVVLFMITILTMLFEDEKDLHLFARDESWRGIAESFWRFSARLGHSGNNQNSDVAQCASMIAGQPNLSKALPRFASRIAREVKFQTSRSVCIAMPPIPPRHQSVNRIDREAVTMFITLRHCYYHGEEGMIKPWWRRAVTL